MAERLDAFKPAGYEPPKGDPAAVLTGLVLKTLRTTLGAGTTAPGDADGGGGGASGAGGASANAQATGRQAQERRQSQQRQRQQPRAHGPGGGGSGGGRAQKERSGGGSRGPYDDGGEAAQSYEAATDEGGIAGASGGRLRAHGQGREGDEGDSMRGAEGVVASARRDDDLPPGARQGTAEAVGARFESRASAAAGDAAGGSSSQVGRDGGGGGAGGGGLGGGSSDDDVEALRRRLEEMERRLAEAERRHANEMAAEHARFAAAVDGPDQAGVGRTASEGSAVLPGGQRAPKQEASRGRAGARSRRRGAKGEDDDGGRSDDSNVDVDGDGDRSRGVRGGGRGGGGGSGEGGGGGGGGGRKRGTRTGVGAGEGVDDDDDDRGAGGGTTDAGAGRSRSGHSGKGSGDSGGGRRTMVDAEVQVSLGRGTSGSPQVADEQRGNAEPSGKRGRELPSIAVTSLAEIKFNRKDVKAMNVLMCRRLVAALYQVKADVNAAADKESKPHQPFPEFVPDQFIVLYGIKSLAIKNINEFLYGVRAARHRQAADASQEPEPLLHFFWQASWHGVPYPERRSAEDFDAYLDLLALTAKCVSDDHRIENVAGIGAFWNLLGSMHELQLPLFILLTVLQKHLDGRSELLERVKKAVLARGAKFRKEVPKPAPSYKPLLLGSAELDSRGHLPLHEFLRLTLDAIVAQRVKDGEALNEIYATWAEGSGGGASFDSFAEMLGAAQSDMAEEQMLSLYQSATSGDDPDVVDMALCEAQLRKQQVKLKKRPEAVVATSTTGTSVLGKQASRWRVVGKAATMGRGLIKQLMLGLGDAAADESQAEPAAATD